MTVKRVWNYAAPIRGCPDSPGVTLCDAQTMIRLHVATLVAATGLILLVAGTSGDVATSASLDPPSSLPTTPSGRYMLTGFWATPGAMLRVGNTIYVGGAFSRIANRTGSAIVVPGSGGGPAAGFPEIAGGSVSASVADGTDGWYLGGSFTNVRSVVRPGLAHVHGGGVLDAAFTPEALGEVHTLALAGSVLYAGGVQPGMPAPVLRALDATTGAALPVSFKPPADSRNLLALVADADRLYVAFSSGMFGSSVVAFDAATGLQIDALLPLRLIE